MLHFTRNATIAIPLAAAVFAPDGSPVMGAAADIAVRVLCLDNGQVLDASDNTFRASPAQADHAVAAFTAKAHTYYRTFTAATWPRGHFAATFTHATTGAEYVFPFTVGLHTPRQLAAAATYDGATLNISAWVEEAGEAQVDYVSLSDCKILDGSGATLATLADATVPTAGVFHLSAALTVTGHTRLIFATTANVPGPAGAFSFPLRVSLARP